ncbi:MAG: tetratricopeptide repeat protein [Bryobacteraceae bacterium]
MPTSSFARFASLALLSFAVTGLAVAQQMPQDGGSIGTSTGVGNSRGTRPSIGETDMNLPTQRPIFLSGKVMLDDGTAPQEPIRIQRVCGANGRTEGFTDRKGHFSFELGRNQGFQDASDNPFDQGAAPGFGSQRGMGGLNGRNPIERSLFGCELRASLPGFRSESVPLANIHYLDNPDIGTIVLHRVAKVNGLTVSATLALAPKDARKAYEKGQELLNKRNSEEAIKYFQKAVDVYPRHAAAWFELGKIQEGRDLLAEARKSYQQSIGADSKFIPPHQKLATMAANEKQWQEVADHTGEVLKLDPLDYPDMYYMNGVAQFELKYYDLAEKQMREAIRLDSTKKMLRAHYVLGLALAQQQKFGESAQSLRTFVDGAGDSPDMAIVRAQLAQVEESAQANTAGTAASNAVP